jgi:succinate dehydrogenase flavin-adding protein (antitoxin of CptAB toxin-antitoxin module)
MQIISSHYWVLRTARAAGRTSTRFVPSETDSRSACASGRDYVFGGVRNQTGSCSKQIVSTVPDKDALAMRKHRCMYRATQRGLRELDVLLGEWTRRKVGQLSERQVAELEQILACESPQLFQYITGQLEPPTDLGKLPLFQQLLRDTRHCSKSP